jgi:CcmD family protein
MSSGEKYVAGAYLVVFAVVLVYLVIMATKLARLERDVSELVERIRRRPPEPEPSEEQPGARAGAGVG